MAKKLDYASMFTLRRDGRYCHTYTTDKRERKYIYDRDPQTLYNKMLKLGEPQKLTFGMVAEEWWRNHVETLSRGTQAAYKAPFELITEEHGEFAITAVTAAEINRMMLAEKSKGYSYKHAACVKSLYSQIINYAISDFAQMIINPVSAVRVPRGLKRTTREAPEDDVIKIIQDNADKPFGLFPLFLLYTGFRAGEALGVKWEDISFKAKTITCKRSIERRFGKPYESDVKTDAGYRTVPLLEHLGVELRKVKGKPTSYVFSNEGKLYTTSEVRARWTAWCKSVGLAELVETTIKGKDGSPKRKTYYTAKITEHQLRHGYATLCYEAGIDEMTCMELMGHADIGTVRKVYTHLRQKQKSKATELLNAKFKEIQENRDDVV